jgi:hypothetical protein
MPLDLKTRNILDKLRSLYRGMRLDETLLALRLLGWTTEPIVSAAPLHYEDHPIQKDFHDERSADKFRDVLREDLVDALPRTPKVDRYYIMDIVGPRETIYSPFTISYRAWRGVEGWRVTSPTGETFELLAKPLDRIRSRDRLKALPLISWLKQTTAPAAAQKMFKEDYDARLHPDVRTRENTGTCGCCLRNIKLREKQGAKDPIVVLHGYKRPGSGHVQGHCPGEAFPPYELSDAATRHLRGMTQRTLGNLRVYLDELHSGTLQEIQELGRSPVRRADVSLDVWEQRIHHAVGSTKGWIDKYERTLRACDDLIADWKLRPLPKPGTETKRWKDMYF